MGAFHQAAHHCACIRSPFFSFVCHAALAKWAVAALCLWCSHVLEAHILPPSPVMCRRVIYHGPVGGALPFFETLGFVCPTRKDPASFLQEVTTPKGALLTCCHPFPSPGPLARHDISRARQP